MIMISFFERSLRAEARIAGIEKVETAMRMLELGSEPFVYSESNRFIYRGNRKT